MPKPLTPLIQKDTYQVFLMGCPATMPLSFAMHPWFVVNKKGTVSRFGVGRYNTEESGKFFGEHSCEECSGRLHKNAKPPFEGLEIFPSMHQYHWKGVIIGMVEGGVGSVAERMAEYIEHSISSYPHRDHYSLFGPNSNTYVQWVLNNFPESNIQLPWNAFGKGKHTS